MSFGPSKKCKAARHALSSTPSSLQTLTARQRTPHFEKRPLISLANSLAFSWKNPFFDGLLTRLRPEVFSTGHRAFNEDPVPEFEPEQRPEPVRMLARVGSVFADEALDFGALEPAGFHEVTVGEHPVE